ncbi:MAG: hypothetical protein KJP16_05255 [Gammaproteobacteria bacterium]|nr:hypothetical protein [Gammaproteobacteria bacterium]NNL50206.1 hypothetical protein [Woeseiaceae bacterium]
MNARLITLSALMALSGCALNPEYVASLDSWVGSPVVDFFAQHREPNSMIDMIDYRIYVWDRSTTSASTVPVTTTCTTPIDLGGGIMSQPVCTNYGGQTTVMTSQCAWKLRVNKENIITGAELIGDACNANERPVSRK